MNKPKLFPGFPQGDFGALREGIIRTASLFAEEGGEKNRKIASVLSVLGDAMADQKLYENVYKGVEKDYTMYHNWWNREMYKNLGGEIGSGKLIALAPDEMPKHISDAVEGVSYQGMYLLQMQIQASKYGGQLSRMGTHPDFDEQLNVFHKIIWFVYMAILYPNGLNMISKIFISNSSKSGKNWA
jgi:hypothetical protein